VKPFIFQKKSTLSNIKPTSTPLNIKPCFHEERTLEEQKFNGGGESFGGERVEGRE
jgi:hypothetical protein